MPAPLRSSTWIAAADIGVMFAGSTIVTPLYVLYQREFGFSGVMLTLIYSAYALGNVGALFLVGRLSDQIGRKRVVLPAIGLAGVATLLFFFAKGIGWLFAARALSGFGIGITAGAGMAWVAELVPGEDKSLASTVATVANFGGLAAAPLLAGLLAEYAPAPLHAPFVVYFVVLAAAALATVGARETVEKGERRVSLRPRVGVPKGIRMRFLSPAATAFANFALIGFYAALVPTLLARDLQIGNKAAAGAIACELFAVAALGVYATRAVTSRTAMLAGASLLIPSVGLLVAAQALHSLALLVVGAAVNGVAAALCYRGTLQVVNEIAPPDKRAEVLSSYQIVAFLGNAGPVIGVGVLTAAFGPKAATGSLAVVVALLACLALAVEILLGKR
ncbi:MAG TPA: MFS transporter [Burkholderiales bacterium]|jgi:MFS family permease|nr:MFS transporter [Burkholderiales bacterium]HEX2650755.1 MFS transporter [Burkholderiales bacterium]